MLLPDRKEKENNCSPATSRATCMIKNNSKTYLLAGFMAAAGLAILVYLGISGSNLKVYSTGEFLAAVAGRTEASAEALAGAPAEKEAVQVYGRIKSVGNGSENIIQLEDWEDPEQVLQIYHQGQNPARLKPGQDVFVTGTWRPAQAVLKATEIITTCPAKYEARRPQE